MPTIQHPALIIGLGGTGKQVLLNFRRMYYERYGSTRPPYVGHLWVDTDYRNLTIDGKEMDFLMQEVNFAEEEKIGVEVGSKELKKIYDNTQDYPYIFSWFDKELMKLGPIVDGAGGIRSFGRLAFFYHYTNIMAKVRNLLGKINDVNIYRNALTEQGIQVDAKSTDVWLIFSIAGGTGNGMFLDFAFALRHLLPGVRIRSIILLPSVFSNDFSNKYYGNAYSALMELEHYGYGRDVVQDGVQGGFPLAWTRELYDNGETLSGPVFDTTYLIDNAPASHAGQVALDNKNALCRMMAEWLYIEYSSGPEVAGLVAKRREDEVAFADALNMVFTHQYDYQGVQFKEIFSRRYSSFGLSKLYVPVDRVETAVQHRLVKDLIVFWTGGREIPADLDNLLERDYFRKVRINNSTEHRDFIHALETDGTGGRLSHILKGLIRDGGGEFIRNVYSAQVRKKMEDWRQDILQGQLDRKDIQAQRGKITKSILQNSEDHYKVVIENLGQLVTEMLNEPHYRFDVTLEVLHRMCSRLSNDVEQFKKMEERSRASSNNVAGQVLELLRWLDDVNGRFTRQTVIEVALESIERQMIRELQAQIAGAAAVLASRVADYIGRGTQDKNAQGEKMTVESCLIKQVMDYRDALKNDVLSRLNERIHAFEKIEPSPIYQELSQGVQETDFFYVDQNNNPIGENTLTLWEKNFFGKQEAAGPSDLWDMRNTLKQGEKKLIVRLLYFAKKTMSHIRDRRVDVIERLSERHKTDTPQYKAVVDQLLSYGKHWLPEPDHFVGNALREKESRLWVAVSEQQGSEPHEDFKNDVMQSETCQFLATTSDRVYAASEIAAFPLMAIRNLKRYRDESYYRYLQDGKVLHTDLAYEKFQDLLLKKSDEVESYIGALRIFLQATLLGVIKAEKSNTGLMKYVYVDDSQIFSKSTKLGPFSLAIARLARSQEKASRDGIQARVVDAINSMDDKTMQKWCTLLSFHAEWGENASFFSRFPETHAVRQILKQEADTLIAQNGDRMKQAVLTELNNLTTWATSTPPRAAFWAVEQPEGAGIYIFESWRR
ncbi:hypothetical protein PN36_07625 [Candidatus Thiomargarita nelsonii]|uniref:Tubulin like n=1 Tax=Candidatus Thiomargarita nelsonii TaxID=1003181 RepID=A0A0A6P1E4_9GAMM|nr:hypothetical protein PN36_07625 [Candidatus Thiomargarita nelsonii]